MDPDLIRLREKLSKKAYHDGDLYFVQANGQRRKASWSKPHRWLYRVWIRLVLRWDKWIDRFKP
jgi:hypothetical protein